MKTKMKISELKVTSFVTNLNKETEFTVKGGISGNNTGCHTNQFGCKTNDYCTWESELYTACGCETVQAIKCAIELPHDVKKL